MAVQANALATADALFAIFGMKRTKGDEMESYGQRVKVKIGRGTFVGVVVSGSSKEVTVRLDNGKEIERRLDKVEFLPEVASE